MGKEYVRDGRSPAPSNAVCSAVMSANRGRNTSPEIMLRKALRTSGFGGYRLHWKVPGRPDICYPGKRLAIFVNGCFWHRCPMCGLPLPKSNTEFWVKKFQRNIERDREKKDLLEKSGWFVITAWECEIKNDMGSVLERIINYM